MCRHLDKNWIVSKFQADLIFFYLFASKYKQTILSNHLIQVYLVSFFNRTKIDSFAANINLYKRFIYNIYTSWRTCKHILHLFQVFILLFCTWHFKVAPYLLLPLRSVLVFFTLRADLLEFTLARVCLRELLRCDRLELRLPVWFDLNDTAHERWELNGDDLETLAYREVICPSLWFL